MNLTEELRRIKSCRTNSHRIAVLPPTRRTNPDEEVIKHPTPKGFPTLHLQLFGRPKKLASWGFKLSEAKRFPVRVIKPEQEVGQMGIQVRE